MSDNASMQNEVTASVQHIDGNTNSSCTSAPTDEPHPSTVVGFTVPVIVNALHDSTSVRPKELVTMLKMSKKLENVQSLLPTKIVDVEAKILLRSSLRLSYPQYVSVRL